MMLKKIQQLFKKTFSDPGHYLVEGMYADQYSSSDVKFAILKDYRKRYPTPIDTPYTHPWKFDPLNPPAGWRYDPYYEVWTQETTQ